MKKIISMLSVLAIVLSMCTTVSFAADNELVLTTVDQTETSMTVSVSLATNMNLNKIGVYLGLEDAYEAGLVKANVTITDAAAGLTKNVHNKGYVLFTYASTDTPVESKDGSIYLGTVNFDLTNATRAFKLNLSSKVKAALTFSDDSNADVSASFTGGNIDTFEIVKKAQTVKEPGVSAAQDYYYSADGGATKDIEVKAWDVVAENDGTGFVSLYFSSASENVTNKKYTAKHSVEGETAVEFKALMLNAPADLTCALTAAN